MSITEINSDLLTKKEAASYIRVTERWMQRATTHGIPVIKIGKFRMFLKSDLDAYIDRSRKAVK
jgi:excisionase family DNA binding protein